MTDERKPAGTAGSTCAAVAAALFLAGCSTPGPLHLYSTSATPQVVHDVAITTDVACDVPAFVEASERVVGFAYDPFTDHFFLRLAPGDRMRVVDRPARKIKREFPIAGAKATEGDLAICPRDGHVFLIDGPEPELLETTRLGEFVRRLPLENLRGRPTGVAVDMKTEELLVLASDLRTLRRFDRSGHAIASVELDRAVSAAVAYDADQAQLYAQLPDTHIVGVFDRAGHLVRTIELAAGDTLIDAGPHSFFRMF